MAATRKEPKSLAKLLGGEEKPAENGYEEHGGGGSLVGSIGAGLGKFFANLLPAGFKKATITDNATQIVKTPLGGQIIGIYTSTIEIEGAPEIIKGIEAAREETERAAIEAGAEVDKARIEAGKAAEEE